MCIKSNILAVLVLGMSASVTAVQAGPLALNYTVTQLGGGIYDYEFSLILDNNDNSWSLGQGWNWLTFGDALSSPTPLTDFIGDPNDLPIGPWTGYTFSSGYHNGPTFIAGGPWVPTSVGETVYWSGTSTANLVQGELLFSALHSSNGAVLPNFEIANRIGTVPVPAADWLFGSGLLGLIGVARRKKV
jgi:hypothetical protein